ncbi:phospholipase D-like domain-containing protein [Sphingomonas tabacisoli]|uniref:Phospholipase D-like domain-containing protein n=1 Tax=Sphingomonas tabacisoli TaxID=2249466 RepID=A0ABW4HXF4_9SPHN
MQSEILPQGGGLGLSLAAALKPCVLSEAFDRLDVAVAYATLQGIRALDRVTGTIPVTRWILGLDDAITQPAAIAHLQNRAGAELRVARLSPVRRFHPKLYRFWSSTAPESALLVIGSGNMTQRGLQENAEAAVLLRAEDAADARNILSAFEELWAIGHEPSAQELADYAIVYAATAVDRRNVSSREAAPPEPAAQERVEDMIPTGKTSEAVIGVAVARLAAAQPDGICTLNLAKRMVPRMIALTADDLAPSNSQPNAKWVQRLRNIQSNWDGGPASNNPIARGYLEHVDSGYRITAAGRAMLARRGYSAAIV